MATIKSFEDFLDRMQGLLDNAKKQGHIIVRVEDLENAFPELADSDDERIRKRIITLINAHGQSMYKDEMLAWLEKQEEKPIGICSRHATGKLREMIKDIESADKVEPKFHKGEWVVYNNDICQIVKREEGCNKLVTVFGIEKELVNDKKSFNCTALDYPRCKGSCQMKRDEQKPTDEEMKEALRAEYEKGRADAIAEMQKSAWSEDDEEEFQIAIDTLVEAGQRDSAHWLKSFKDRVQPKVELTQLDKNILEAAIAFVEHNNHFNCWRGVDKHTVLSALHSLRPQNQWKPSDEQIEALIWQTSNTYQGSWQYKASKELLEQLKKLRDK